MQHFELKLSDGRTVSWTGTDGVDAATRYVDAHRDAVVVAWRHPRVELVIGTPNIAG